ncbi:MAG: hypothetical protein ABIR30_02245 [Chitinophagaceae bacterium]
MKSVLLFLLLGFRIHASAQPGAVIPVPTSVEVLGEPYITVFKEQATVLGKVEADLAARKTQFMDISSLVAFACSKWSEYSRLACRVDQAAITAHMGSIGQGGDNYGVCIENQQVSSELKKILLDINAAFRRFEVETDLNSTLYAYSSNLSAHGLNRDDEERLKMYIVCINFNYHVLMNSTVVRQRVALYANGPVTDRTVWGWIKAALRCSLGTIGGALVGGLGGMAVGTGVLPVVGTVSGAAVGFWGGAMTGASQSCF